MNLGTDPAAPLQVFCFACGAQIDPRAELCPKCGVRQAQPSASPPNSGKSRVTAIALALLLGWVGVHKFYLGKVPQGILYLLFFWTGIPALIGWIEGVLYLLKSDEEWVVEYGGPSQESGGFAIGCLWVLALVPLLSVLGIVALIFLGGQVSAIAS